MSAVEEEVQVPNDQHANVRKKTPATAGRWRRINDQKKTRERGKWKITAYIEQAKDDDEDDENHHDQDREMKMEYNRQYSGSSNLRLATDDQPKTGKQKKSVKDLDTCVAAW